MHLRLLYSTEAAADLEDIYRHIAPDSPAAAEQFVRAIEARCDALRTMPNLGMARPDLGAGLRILPMRRRVVIAYRTVDRAIEMLHIFYGGRDFEALLGEG
jgi:toxin ParE1/3/4